jgi:hypothetical protein
MAFSAIFTVFCDVCIVSRPFVLDVYASNPSSLLLSKIFSDKCLADIIVLQQFWTKKEKN